MGWAIAASIVVIVFYIRISQLTAQSNKLAEKEKYVAPPEDRLPWEEDKTNLWRDVRAGWKNFRETASFVKKQWTPKK